MRRALLSAGVSLLGWSAVAQPPQRPNFWPAGGSPQLPARGVPASPPQQFDSGGQRPSHPLPALNTAPAPVSPLEPRTLPPGLGVTPPQAAKPLVAAGPQQQAPTPADTPFVADPTVRLPQKENLARIDPNGLTARRGGGDRWQVVNGFQVVREFASGQADAEEFVRLLRDLRPTAWAAVGTGRTVVEYGLRDDQAVVPAFSPKTAVTIDPGSVRAELVRGVWVIRDDDNILLNFGTSRDDADQAMAVIRKYGFNRLAQVGPAAGGATVLFAQPQAPRRPAAAGPYSELARQYQESQLTRTGLDVPAGGGAVGERITIDPKACDVRREKGHWVLAHGAEVLADFGASEWSARDALKLVQEQRFTEFCRFNADVTFFLVNGQPPTRVPFAVQAVRFDKEAVAVKGATNGKFGVYEGMGRQLFVCDTEKEAKQLVTVLKHYGFDTSCQMGLSGKSSLKFLAKTGR